MKKEIKELYPNWINNINNKEHNAGFTADMDGLLCSSFAKEFLGIEVNSFYDFKDMSILDRSDIRETIFFDSALKENKCFDNHMTRLDATSYINTQSANINNVSGVHRDRYTDKFAMSTLIQLYALYNVALPTSLQGKMILLCCDVGFKGFYDNRYRDTFLSYLEKFEMMELVKVLEMFSSDQMYEFMLRANMNAKIIREISHNRKGQLYIETSSKNPYGTKWMNFETGMDLDWYEEHLGYNVELPKGSFEVVESFKTRVIDYWELDSQLMDNAFSYAFINQQKVMISMRGESI